MRKHILLMSVCLSLCLLAGCAGSTEPSSKPVVPPESDLLPAGKTGESIVIEDGLPWFMTLRIVSGAETGELVLAENSETGSGVYTLSTRSLSRKDLPKDPLQDGQLINVYYESFTESWPMNFGGVSAIEIVDSSFNNRAAIYLQVLEDLWDKDSFCFHSELRCFHRKSLDRLFYLQQPLVRSFILLIIDDHSTIAAITARALQYVPLSCLCFGHDVRCECFSVSVGNTYSVTCPNIQTSWNLNFTGRICYMF